jgi:hypothetical protein
MSNVLSDIFHLFSTATVDKKTITENLTEVKLSVLCSDLVIPSEKKFSNVVAEINSRDSINISIVQNHSTWNYVQEDTNCDLNQFLQDCSTIQHTDEKEIIVSLTKKKINNTISIYCIDNFTNNLNSLSFAGFLLKLNEVFSGSNNLIFEVQNESFSEFSTPTIKFIPKEKQIQNSGIRNTNSLVKIKNLCHCNIIDKYQFVPDDFYPTTKNNTILDEIFSRMALLYSTIFLFDIFSIDSTVIEYRLNGYRTINQKINFANIDISSYEIYYQIYSWVYEGGNIVDKIGLARNILSLNFDKKNLKLSETTFEAIKSGYKIYQKENIKQYIEIRNKISDQLIELQNKADKIVENFVDDYKKTFLAVVSFFISVIVIRVVSKGDFTGGFTKEVTLLTIGFLSVSLLVMFFALGEINKQIKRYEEFYKNLKARYADLLDPSDISRILNNDKDFDCNKKFIEKKRCSYTILWVVSLIIMLVITVTLFASNNINCCTIIKLIICFTKNI